MAKKSTFPIPRPSHALKALRAVAFSPDGSVLWALAEGKLLRSERGRAEPSWLPVFSSASHLASSRTGMALAGGTKVARLDGTTGKITPMKRPAGGKKALDLQYSPDGEFLAVFGEGEVDVFRVDGAHVRRIRDAAFANGLGTFASSKHIVTARGYELVAFPIADGKPWSRAMPHMPEAKPLLMACTVDAVVLHYEAEVRRHRWEPSMRFMKADGTRLKDFQTRSTRYFRLSPSTDGKRVVAAGHDVIALVWSSTGKTQTKVKRETSNPPEALALSGDSLADAQLNIDVLRAP